MATLSFCQALRAFCLTLLSAGVSAQQIPFTANFSSPRPMSHPQQITAFFYKQPVELERAQHKGLHLKAGDARFASKNQAVPLLATEFPEACLEYPIVFTKDKDDQWMGLALTGLTAERNAFVNAKGAWTGRYMPLSVRRYPFILAEGADQQLSLAADLSAPQLGSEGQALFDNTGEPTELARSILNTLGEFQAQAKVTQVILGKLDEAQLLSQQSLQVRLGDGRNAVVDGVWIVRRTA